MQDARVRAALLVICLLCLGGSGAVLYAGHRAAPMPPVVISPPPAGAAPDSVPPETPAAPDAPAAKAAPPARVYVDVAGAVRRPSLYVLPANSRVMQALRAAGGPSGDADLDAVNLAEKVTDGEKVFVPHRGRPGPSTTPMSAAAPPVPSPTGGRKAGEGSDGTAKDRGHGSKIAAGSGETVSLNTATTDDLERLPGVGPSMAGRILAYRRQSGGFGKVEDLMQVTGIGPKKFAKIAPLVTL